MSVPVPAAGPVKATGTVPVAAVPPGDVVPPEAADGMVPPLEVELVVLVAPAVPEEVEDGSDDAAVDAGTLPMLTPDAAVSPVLYAILLNSNDGALLLAITLSNAVEELTLT